ncbi:hypothetical protein C479_01606 [Halovivax asiaticus JCM 14624]|uniref:HEWD domain-containing protein n=1 Tax=Halovivax asiaticus JCM 14624 TaxID=1227490 RepID=M0BRF9_9EURY|nr:hypothetical protein C479_01606 [Halovivax asiaticus JCM 14624]
MATDGQDRSIRAPDRRRCEQCGRVETWDPLRQQWAIADATRRDRTRRWCIHEWDITGTFCPVESADR